MSWLRTLRAAWRRRRAAPDFHEQLARALSDSTTLRLRAGAIERYLQNEEADGSLPWSGREARR